MSDTETSNWKFPEGWLTLTKSELGQCVSAGATHIQSCFDWEKNYTDRIEAATTKEELLQIEQDIKDEETPMMSTPASAKPKAIPLPMPLLHPVTRAVFPARSNKVFIDQR